MQTSHFCKLLGMNLKLPMQLKNKAVRKSLKNCSVNSEGQNHHKTQIYFGSRGTFNLISVCTGLVCFSTICYLNQWTTNHLIWLSPIQAEHCTKLLQHKTSVDLNYSWEAKMEWRGFMPNALSDPLSLSIVLSLNVSLIHSQGHKQVSSQQNF